MVTAIPPAADASAANRLEGESGVNSASAAVPSVVSAAGGAATTAEFAGSGQMGGRDASQQQASADTPASPGAGQRVDGAAVGTGEPASMAHAPSRASDTREAAREEGADRGDANAAPLIAGPSQHRPVDAPPVVEHAARPGTPLGAQLAQGVELASQRPGHSVRLVLQPEGLGEVSVQVGFGPGGVNIHIGVDSAAVRDLVRGSASDLSQALSQRGVAIEGFAVDLANGQAQGGSGGQSAYQPPTPSFRYASRASQSTGESRRVEAPETSLNRVDYRV
jgi:flagellar hook-length control protein FliK